MSKRQKRLEKLRQNPKNVSFDDLRLVLEDFGFELKNIVGSHHTFGITIAEISHLLVIPFHRPIKSIYIKKALTLIDLAIENEAKEDEDDETGKES